METIIIGVASIGYDQNGKATFANFIPEIKKDLDSDSLNKLKTVVDQKTTKEDIKENADMILAHWFSQLNEIELAERPHYKITSDIVNCERYDDGKIKLCVIRYSFEQVNKEYQQSDLN